MIQFIVFRHSSVYRASARLLGIGFTLLALLGFLFVSPVLADDGPGGVGSTDGTSGLTL